MDVSYLISGSSAFSKSMGFPKQEYCSGLPFPSPGYLPDPGIEPGSPTLQADSLRSEPPEKPVFFEGRTYMKRKCCNTIEKQSNSRCGFYASKYPNIYDYIFSTWACNLLLLPDHIMHALFQGMWYNI